MDKRRFIERLVNFPIELKRSGKSFNQTLKDTGLYKSLNITEAEIIAELQNYPELINEWIEYSESKRVSSGWYILKDNTEFKVGYHPEGKHQTETHQNAAQACARFIVRELGL